MTDEVREGGVFYLKSQRTNKFCALYDGHDSPSGGGDWPSGGGDWPGDGGDWPMEGGGTVTNMEVGRHKEHGGDDGGDWPSGGGDWPSGQPSDDQPIKVHGRQFVVCTKVGKEGRCHRRCIGMRNG
jgi:hypothetical protein